MKEDCWRDGVFAYPNGEGGIKVIHRSCSPRPVEGHCPSLAAIKGLLAHESSLSRKRSEARCHAYGTGGRGLSGGSEDAREHIVWVQRSDITAGRWQDVFKLKETSTDGLG